MSTDAFKVSSEDGAAMALEELGPLAAPVGVPLGGPMATRGRTFWRSPDGRILTGIWEVEKGRMRAEFSAADGEMIHCVKGRMVCIEDGGPATEIGPGDVMTFPPGWTGEWRIEQTMRKFYTVFQV